MSKGISSSGSLKALAYPIQQFLTSWGARQRISKNTPHTELPAPYALAAVRGEAVLRQRFFDNFMQKLPVQLDAAQQLALWHNIVETGGHITTWVQRLGVAKALRREAALPEQAAQESRLLYTVLLQALSEQAAELLPWAAEAYFYHIWRVQFSQQASPTSPNKTTANAQLRQQLTHILRKHHGTHTRTKESFKEHQGQIQFSLLYKTQHHGQWHTLVTLERPRLKTARNAAYAQALEQLRQLGQINTVT